MPKHIFIILTALIGAGVGVWIGFGEQERPNVVLISIDSLRPDHLGCYGYARPTSPNLDSLAKEGVLFTAATSSTSWTLPSHAALFTGLSDSVHGCRNEKFWLAKNRDTVAEQFKRAGYKTAGFFAGPFLHPHFGLSQGFQSYHDCTSFSKLSIATLKGRPDLAGKLLDESHRDVTGPTSVREVGKWLKDNGSGPRFLFVHLWDVHFDYIPPKPYDTMFDPDYKGPVTGKGCDKIIDKKPAGWTDRDVAHLKALYDGEIRWTDDNLSKLLALFKEHGMTDDNTIIAIFADHGEAFYEHGRFGHQQSLHEEEIRIPLILHAPGRIPSGRRVDTQAHIIDIAPTVLALAGLDPLPQAMGRDLTPLLLGAGREWRRKLTVSELFLEEGLAQFAMRGASWKHIRDYENKQTLVYDLAKDPGETRPLTGKELPIPKADLARFERTQAEKLQKAAAAMPLPALRDTPDIPKMTIEQLRSMGYLK